jgi:hypothetical protein
MGKIEKRNNNTKKRRKKTEQENENRKKRKKKQRETPSRPAMQPSLRAECRQSVYSNVFLGRRTMITWAGPVLVMSSASGLVLFYFLLFFDFLVVRFSSPMVTSKLARAMHVKKYIIQSIYFKILKLWFN